MINISMELLTSYILFVDCAIIPGNCAITLPNPTVVALLSQVISLALRTVFKQIILPETIKNPQVRGLMKIGFLFGQAALAGFSSLILLMALLNTQLI